MLIAIHYIRTYWVAMAFGDRKSETGRPTHFLARCPGAILNSRRTRFRRLLAKFVAPFRDIAFKHGENFAFAFDIQNSQSRGSSTHDLDHGRRRKHRGHSISVDIEGGRNYGFT